MSQANVYTSVANAVWYTDKCEIVTSSNAVTYNIYVMPAGNPRTGLIGSVTSGSNVMIAPDATANLVNATFVTGPGVANTFTVSSVTVGTGLVMSNNATSNQINGSYILTVGAPGNLYSAAPQVSANSRQQIYVGAGNYLTITGSGFTAREIGTASSAVAGH